MGFHEVRFPTNISYGSRGGPGYFTNIVVNDAGTEERVARWESPKRHYDVAYGIKSPQDLYDALAFYIARLGPAYGFRYKDWIDYATTTTGNIHVPPSSPASQYEPQVVSPTDVEVGTGDGTRVAFQLVKRYTSGPTVKVRTITKPVDGTVLVAVDGTPLTTGWSVDATTGILLFTAAPEDGASVTAGFEFDVPVRFGKEIDENAIRAGLDDFGYGKVESIPLVEIRDGLAVADDAYCGGAVEACMRADYQLSAGYARGYVLEPNVAGLSVLLPDATTVPPGGPIFWLINVGPNAVTLKTSTGSTLGTLDVNRAFAVLLTVDGSGAKQWYLI